MPVLYHELVPWYHLVDPPEDHREEVLCFQEAFERVVSPRPETLLELGSGAGNNALHLARRFTCTLTDLSEDMLSLSREQNPGCEHILADMRTLRLGRMFDVVLVHDAIMYMLTEEELSAAVETAFVHTGLMWTWDPHPEDSTYRVDFGLLLREGDTLKAVHDQHVEGLFSRELWHRVLSGVGFRVASLPRPLGDGTFDDIFLCQRP